MGTEEVKNPWCKQPWLTRCVYQASEEYLGACCARLALRTDLVWNCWHWKSPEGCLANYSRFWFTTYRAATKNFCLETLQERRVLLCKKFGKKAVKHPKHDKWFVPNTRTTITRQEQPKYCPVICKTKRFEQSPLSYLTSLLNKYCKQWKWTNSMYIPENEL